MMLELGFVLRLGLVLGGLLGFVLGFGGGGDCVGFGAWDSVG